MKSGWNVRKIWLALYPFGASAAAVNVYFASLILSWVNVPVLSPLLSCFVGAVLGVPMTWWFAKHMRRLMDRADP